jgi:hypothetical protein
MCVSIYASTIFYYFTIYRYVGNLDVDYHTNKVGYVMGDMMMSNMR